MVRRLFPVFVLGLFLFAVPSALAATSPTQTASHQDGLNTVSGAGGPDPSAPAGATPEESVANQFPPNSVETFRFEVQEGEENGSFSVSVAFPTFVAPTPDIDMDIYVYRIRDNGTLDPAVIASAASLDDPEIADYASADASQPFVRADEYIVAVHNYCSQTSDNPTGCPGLPDQPADAEDRWEAEVTFAPYDPTNKRPTVSLAGPATAQTGQSLTYTADANDPDGTIATVAFDLNGDGIHETNRRRRLDQERDDLVRQPRPLHRRREGDRQRGRCGLRVGRRPGQRAADRAGGRHDDGQAQTAVLVQARAAGVRRAQEEQAGDPLPAARAGARDRVALPRQEACPAAVRRQPDRRPHLPADGQAAAS